MHAYLGSAIPYSPFLSLSLFLVSYCEADVSPEFVRIHVDHDHADKAATLTAGTDHNVRVTLENVKTSCLGNAGRAPCATDAGAAHPDDAQFVCIFSSPNFADVRSQPVQAERVQDTFAGQTVATGSQIQCVLPARTNLDHTITVKVEYQGKAVIPVPFGGKAGYDEIVVGSTDAPTAYPTNFPTSSPTHPPKLTWDFADGNMHGWSCRAVTECGHYGKVCGGYGAVAGGGAEITKTITNLVAGWYHLSLDFLKLDSWDNEHGYVYVNGHQCWSKSFNYNEGGNACGDAQYGEVSTHVTCNILIDSSKTLEVRVTSNLNEHPHNEAMGIRNVVLERTA